MHPVSIALILAAIYLLWYWYRRRSGGRLGDSRLLLMIYDGQSYVLHDARRDHSGNLVAVREGVTWPAGTYVPVVNESSAVPMYVLAAQPLALAEHATLERARQNIAFGSIFKSGGSLMETLQLVGQCAIIVGALYAIMTVQSLSGRMEGFTTKLSILDKPLVSVPAPAPAATVTP